MLKILVVDDATFMRMMLKNIIEKAGHVVIGEACDGNEGLAKYKELKPDLVTLDITMPNMTGLECLKEIMKYDSNAQVVMCSAMGQQIMVLEAIQGGAKDFLVKPFSADRVIETLTKLDK